MEDVIQNFTVLTRKRRSDEALELLKRIASQVKPIMRKRGWKVLHFCEFFPSNPNLLGSNVNKGFKINIRLRPHYDDSAFLEYNDLLGTMLHELTHIVRGPHDDVFYKILDGLNDELDEIILTGQKGYLAFDGTGHKLGSSLGAISGDARARALAAAEQRRRKQGIMIPSGGMRLGGKTNSSLEKAFTPALMAARAAERRMQDRKWCGGLQQEPDLGSSSSPSSSSSSSSNSSLESSSSTRPGSNPTDAIVIPESDDDDHDDDMSRGQKRGRDGHENVIPMKKPTISTMQSRKPIQPSKPTQISSTTIQSSKPTERTRIGWICAACTYENKDLVLTCTMCLTQRPSITIPTANTAVSIINTSTSTSTNTNTDSIWTCPKCTLYNPYSSSTCGACSYSR